MFGVDISEYQGTINVPALPADLALLIVKATNGASYNDPQFARTWRALSGGWRRRGAYHFASASSSPQANAAHFAGIVAAAGGFTRDDFAMLDVESPSPDRPWPLPAGGPSIDWTLATLIAIERATGRVPWLYCAQGWITGILHNDIRLRAFPLAIANINPTADPGAPWPYAIRQFSWHGRVTGIPGTVDLDSFGPAYAATLNPSSPHGPTGAPMPDGTTPVAYFNGSDGGRYVLHADGGVFTVHGAYYGSYPGLRPEHRTDHSPFLDGGPRHDGAAHGYSLLNAAGHIYDFGPEANLQALLTHPTV